MSEEISTQKEQKNTVATVGMIFSIVGLIALITIIFAGFGLPLLLLGFILGIIGLFYKPRGKARVAICIPLVVFIAIFSVIAYIWSSVKTPATQFMDWVNVEFENIDEDNIDKEKFNAIINDELNNIFSSISEEEFSSLIENSTGSNTLEKISYTFFGMLQQGLQNSLEAYNNGLTEIENNDEELDDEENDEENDESEVIEIIDEEDNSDNNESQPTKETFTKSEQNDIEQILNILE